MKLGGLGKIGKLGGSIDEDTGRKPEPADTISVVPKYLWLNKANNNYGEVEVKTKVQWNAF